MLFFVEIIKPLSFVNEKDFICKIELKKNLTIENADKFKYMLSSLIKGGVEKILLDINDLREIDSSGIGALISIIKTIRNENGEIVICRYSEQVITLLRPVNIEKIVRFYSSIDEGIIHLTSIRV